MNQFANALGKKFLENQEMLRVRSFEMNGHTFKVKVPTTLEYEAINENIKIADDELVEKYYQELSKPFIDKKEEFKEESDIQYKDNDIVIKDRSMRETAINKVITEKRITEMFKLIVPEQTDFDMDTITYSMIEELFPFSIQLEIIEAITNTISPGYKATKGK
jgi:hypothetical protein